MIRDEGAMMMIASTEISDKDELAKQLKQVQELKILIILK